MIKENIWNDMGEIPCVEVFCFNDNAKVWFWKYLDSALYTLLLISYNSYKSKKSSKERINFLLQDKWNNFYKKTCGCKTHSYCKRFEEEVNIGFENNWKNATINEKSKFVWKDDLLFFYVKDFFKKEDVSQKDPLEELGLLIVKNNLPIQFIENIQLKWLALHICPK